MRTNGSPCHLLARLISLPHTSLTVNSKWVLLAGVRISTEVRPGTEARQGATTSAVSSMIYRTGVGHLLFHIPCCSHRSLPPLSRPSSSRYDALDSSHRDCHIATGQARRNHSPYSEPAVLVAPYESAATTPRPRSSSAALDRGGPIIQQVSCPNLHRFTQSTYVEPPPPPFQGIRSIT